MAIIKKNHWYGENVDDLTEYLIEYTDGDVKKCVAVKCPHCASDRFSARFDGDEGAIEAKCVSCGEARLLLDSADYWDECDPEEAVCPTCSAKEYNLAVGFVYRDNGDVKWVYVGCRCVECGVLGSFLDWKINYAPTEELEKNV
jgi:hypothetical protein